MMNDALFARLDILRSEYRTKMSEAQGKTQEASQKGDRQAISLHSTEAERHAAGLVAVNRAIEIIDDEMDD